MGQRKMLGEILVEKGIIGAMTVERVVDRSKRFNRRLGMVLEDMELVTSEELTDALATQYGLKVVKNIQDVPFPEELKDLIPPDVAMQYLLFPLKVENSYLALAVADPTDTRMSNNIAANKGLKVIPFIASKKDIQAAICKHLLGREVKKSVKRTVLVVEDDRLILKTLGDILIKKGYHVVPAMDGIDGYKTALIEKPQVIITDMEMPKLHGYGLLNALKNSAETSSIPVILMTGNTMNPEEEAKAFDKGFFDFIPKPVKDVTLVTRVNRAFLAFEGKYSYS